MPKYMINEDDWDRFVRQLYRTGNERVLAVNKVETTKYEVLTVESDSLLEERARREHPAGRGL